jgi:4a-hydroxytetrahydrobiopterin dehydratase
MKSDLNQKHCEACEGITNALDAKQIQNLMPQLDKGWLLDANHQEIKRSFSFANFYETMAFVNALAWIANTENHHPDLELGYNYCHVRYSTHALKGLSLNDFICAAKVDALIASN